MTISPLQQQGMLNNSAAYLQGGTSSLQSTGFMYPNLQSAPTASLFQDAAGMPGNSNSLTQIISVVIDKFMQLIEQLLTRLLPAQNGGTAGTVAEGVTSSTPEQMTAPAQTSESAPTEGASEKKSEGFLSKVGGYLKTGMKIYDTVSDLFGWKSSAKETAKGWANKASGWLEKAGAWARSAGDKVGGWLNTAGDYVSKAGNWIADGASSISNWFSGFFA